MKCSPCLPKAIRESISSIQYRDAHPNSVIGNHLYRDAITAAFNKTNEAVTIRNGVALCRMHLLKAIQVPLEPCL